MRISRVVLIAASLLAISASAASAQDRKIHFTLGGGPTFTGDALGEHFGTGWGPAFGLTFEGPNQRLGFQFEYAYRWFDIKDDAPFFGATAFSANHRTHQLAFNLVGNLTPAGSAVRPYLVGGPGMYHRTVEITEYIGNGVICDPYWYVCGTYPIEAVIGSRGGWDFGFNLGGGVGFGIGEDSEFFVEMRYHKVYGPEIVTTNPLPPGVGEPQGGADGTYYPLTFGFRF